MDEPHEEPDRGALSSSVRAEVAEHLAALDAEIEADERAHLPVVGLRQPDGLDCGRLEHEAIVLSATLGAFSCGPAPFVDVHEETHISRSASPYSRRPNRTTR